MYTLIYMLKSIFFRGGIIEISQKQCEELKRIYKTPMLMKLKLSKIFPKKLLYVRKAFLGLGLFISTTPYNVLLCACMTYDT